MAGVNTLGRRLLEEEFNGGHNMEQWGVGTETTAYTSDEVGGVIALGTGASDDDNHVIAAKGFRPSDGPMFIEARIKAASIALVAFNVGFTDVLDGTTPVLPFEFATATLTTAPTNGAAFLFDVDATTDVLRVGAVKTNVDTVDQAAGEPTALAADTYIVLRVEIDMQGNVSFIADGKLVKYQASAVSASAIYHAFAMVETRTTAAKTIEIDYIKGEGGRGS